MAIEHGKIKGEFTVIDELCKCGHRRRHHEPRALSPELNGHGVCQECDCDKFTWVAWVVN